MNFRINREGFRTVRDEFFEKPFSLQKNKMNQMVEMFSKNLFWDIDETDLNTKKHARFIIERVLSRGRMSDWFVLTSLYSFDKMKAEVVRIRYLDKVTLNFCSTFFHIPKSKFLCYNQPKAIQELWDF